MVRYRFQVEVDFDDDHVAIESIERSLNALIEAASTPQVLKDFGIREIGVFEATTPAEVGDHCPKCKATQWTRQTISLGGIERKANICDECAHVWGYAK